MRPLRLSLLLLLLSVTLHLPGQGSAPRLVTSNGRHALLVDGKPYLILGGQIHNSSAWPSELPQVWQAMAALHANTIAAPVYWEQMEAERGHFHFSNVDAILGGAREHGLHVIFLWFGTWKNGNMHYVPSWVKADGKTFPRVVRPDGEPIDVLSPLSRNTLAADRAAFAALMHHLQEVDGAQHTVLMVQVENESGNVGSVRDNSPEANRLFRGPVPPPMLAAAHRGPGTWQEVFGADADELFQLYYQALYVNEVAAAGKAQFTIPLYANVWVRYPVGQLPQRQIPTPGIGYPSGGAVQPFVGLWKALAPALDIIGPDMYSDDPTFFRDALNTYARPDNPLWVPETGRSDNFAKYLFLALGKGAIGFSPFGVDSTGWNITGDEPWKAHAHNFELLAPMEGELAALNFAGELQTGVEEPGSPEQELHFGKWVASLAYGFPQHDGQRAPGTRDAHGTALVAQLGPDQFLVTGTDVSVTFHLAGRQPWMRSELVTVEQGRYEAGTWKPLRLWNGDETDRGLNFHQTPEVVHVQLGTF